MKRVTFRLITSCLSTTSCKSALSHQFKPVGTMIIAVLMSLVASQTTANAQNPPQYQLTWLNNIWGSGSRMSARHVNDSGVVVGGANNGQSRAFMWDSATGTIDLNDLGGVWNDCGGLETEDGWIARVAQGINESGQIVGTASHGTHEDRIFVLSFPPGSPPEFDLIQRFGIGENRGMTINDLGVIVGFAAGSEALVGTPWSNYTLFDLGFNADILDINNSGVIVGKIGFFGPTAYRAAPDENSAPFYTYTMGAFDPPFEGHWFRGINEAGIICGSRDRKKGRDSYNGGPIRFDFSGTGQELLLATGDVFDWTGGINDAGDVCYHVSGYPSVYMEGGSHDLDRLIVNPDNDWLLYNVYSWGINNNRMICGAAGPSDEKAFILTPITNDPIPGITVTPTSGLETDEAGGSDSFTVVLDTQPLDNVTIGISTSDETEGLIDDPVLGLVVATSLTFTPGNWNVAQTVTVKGVEDFEIDGNVPYMIVTSADTNTTDPDYNGLNPADVTVTNLDNEQPPSVPYNSTGGENNVPILDQSTAISSIVVTDNITITDLNVTLNIDHERVQDLDVFLISDDGLRIELFTDVGGNGQDFTNTTLDDEAATSITAGSAPFTGSFRPEGILGGFDGKSTNGLWTLEVTDDKRRKTGTILNWSFTVEY